MTWLPLTLTEDSTSENTRVPPVAAVKSSAVTVCVVFFARVVVTLSEMVREVGCWARVEGICRETARVAMTASTAGRTRLGMMDLQRRQIFDLGPKEGQEVLLNLDQLQNDNRCEDDQSNNKFTRILRSGQTFAIARPFHPTPRMSPQSGPFVAER